MSREVLENAFFAAWKEYYTLPNIWKRFVANFRYLPFRRSLMFLCEAFLQKRNLNLDATTVQVPDSR
jgi:hypothetical protein